MKTLFLVLAVFPLVVLANSTPGTVPPPPKTKTPPTKNVNVNVNKPTTVISPDMKNQNSVGVTTDVENNVDVRATGGTGVGGAGGTINMPQQKMGYAPDVFSQSTANCMQAYGGSVGVYGFGGGLSGSVANENCEILELSRRFTDMGNKEAANQTLCLSERGNKVLTALGYKCLVSPTPPAPEQPKVTY